VHTTFLPGPRHGSCRPRSVYQDPWIGYPYSTAYLGDGYWPRRSGYSTLFAEYPRTVYVDRPIETIVETYAEQPLLTEPEPLLGQPLLEQPGLGPRYAQPIDPDRISLLPQVDTGAQQDARDVLQRGDAAFAAGDYAEARRQYIRAQLDGVFPGEATLAYALARFAEGEYALSALALRRGLALAPDAIDYPIDIAHLYGSPDDLQRHIDALGGYLAQHPADTHAAFVLGYVWFARGDPAGALEAFEHCIALDPHDPLVHLLREAALTALNAWPPAPTDEEAASPGAGLPVDGAFLATPPPDLL
jgi:tetratricopeptide (TPR) repeat protein